MELTPDLDRMRKAGILRGIAEFKRATRHPRRHRDVNCFSVLRRTRTGNWVRESWHKSFFKETQGEVMTHGS